MSSPPSDSTELMRLARDLVSAAWLEGDFVLRSGRRSNYYFDKYLFETQPSILRRVGKHLAELVPAPTQRLAAPELGAVLLGAAVSLELDLPLVLVRKEAKDHGTARALEGVLEPGDRVTVVEDVLTTGGEAIRAIEKVRASGGTVIGLVAVLDREEGAAQNLHRLGVPFTPLFRKSDLPV
ncbi:MAG TPA: orotate phosphoribosyltransferase [Candidatus Dormibacteraeota bacterium]|jgi:orotate phosphoribosyltransferase|nr:orotate phosphoribosyltransferase [Candidatus Dormibacteraeota bacterium]